jgi:hypothetical protein
MLVRESDQNFREARGSRHKKEFELRSVMTMSVIAAELHGVLDH